MPLTFQGIRPFVCPTCPASFTQKSVLSTHLKTHAKDNSGTASSSTYTCTHCGQGFKQKNSLTSHQLTCTQQQQKKKKQEDVTTPEVEVPKPMSPNQALLTNLSSHIPSPVGSISTP